MAVVWTDDQRRVIETRNSNILVSAAAGSGKTAVLVERIIERVTDPEKPVDIDKLLIVTFTRAAAGEMKERIRNALSDKLLKDPENEYLAGQIALINNARITTIDGFCSYVVRNYAQTIGLAPGFQVAEESVSKLLIRDCLAEVIEEAYADEDPKARKLMADFAETFATNKSEKQMEETILDVYRVAESSPDPEGWLRMCRNGNRVPSKESITDMPWMREYLAEADEIIKINAAAAHENLKLAMSQGGPAAYIPTAESYTQLFDALLKEDSYEERYRILADFSPKALSRKKQKGVDPADISKFKAERDKLKAAADELGGSYYAWPMDMAAEYLNASAGPLDMLLTLTERLMKKCAEEKEKRNIVDFSDLEHFALRILREPDENGGHGRRTDAARELAAEYAEVMVDEYQDSNYLQEAILTAVSRIEDGENNYFCVGDVKQSIYGFRQARPELFMEKFGKYAADPASGTRIDLHKNFRSRSEVVDTVNGIFSQIMRREVGGVEYDEDAALVCGADFNENGKLDDTGLPALDCRTEIMPVFIKEDLPDGEESLMEDGKSATKQELEGRAIGMRIKQLVGRVSIYDSKAGKRRPAEYRDIVILARSKGAFKAFTSVFEEMRIPCYTETRTGYYSAPEVRCILDYLRVLDNPEQDIPFTAVLASPFADLSAGDLAAVRSAGGAKSFSGSTRRSDISMHEAARYYAEHGDRAGIRVKLEDFFSFYDLLRSEMRDISLGDLVAKVIQDSGYGDYAASLPGGVQRAVNLKMLIDQAASFEKNGYTGLFNFVRYIKSLNEQDIDPGEISSISEQENIVRMYTIHKSKGLEYPIVFVSGLGTKLNFSDTSKTVLIHHTMGTASDYVDYRRRVKMTTIKKEAIKSRIVRDSMGEELRILYVAFTRAKQKLILTGSMASVEKMEDLYLNIPRSDTHLPAAYIRNAKNYWDLIMPAVRRILTDNEWKSSRAGRYLMVSPTVPSELAADEMNTAIDREEPLDRLRSLEKDRVYDPKMKAFMDERLLFRYPYAGYENIPVEVSVSEIKEGRYGRAEEEAEPFMLYPEETEKYVPEFIRKRDEAGRTAGKAVSDSEMPETGKSEESMDKSSKKHRAGVPGEKLKGGRLTGAALGSAYHRVMQLISFSEADGNASDASPGAENPDRQSHEAERNTEKTDPDVSASRVKKQMKSLLDLQRISEEEYNSVKAEDVARMAASPLGIRMARAEIRGDLFREQPFVLGVPASELREEWPESEMVFVQGMIDAFFFEGDGIVLVDYKTDRTASPEELAARYGMQLKQYKNALERITGRCVTESVLWSFYFGKAITV